MAVETAISNSIIIMHHALAIV